MMRLRFCIATTALGLAAQSAAAESASTDPCNTVLENGRYRMVCTSDLKLKLPQNPSREEVIYSVRPSGPSAEPVRTNNFCGEGERKFFQTRLAFGGILGVDAAISAGFRNGFFRE